MTRRCLTSLWALICVLPDAWLASVRLLKSMCWRSFSTFVSLCAAA